MHPFVRFESLRVRVRLREEYIYIHVKILHIMMMRSLNARAICTRNRIIPVTFIIIAALLLVHAAAVHRPRPRDPAADARFVAAVAVVGAPSDRAHRYEPSSLEAEWTRDARARARAGVLCAVIASEAPLWPRWLEVSLAARAGAVLPPTAPADTSIWSTMTVSLGGVDAPVRLEPLAGFLRDPREGTCSAHGLTPTIPDFPDSKALIFLDPTFYARVASHLASSSLSPRPRALLFDAGSTRWQSAPVAGQPERSGLAWFIDTYKALGIEFDAVYAWEAAVKPARDYFSDMPTRIAARTHFYNVPVTDAGGGLDDVIAVIKTVSAPGDFVVFKLDIDTEHLEESIVLRLLEEADAGELVDDFFFEHHVDCDIMRKWWGPVDLRDLHDSYSLFAALRKRGIRAHSWP